MQNGWKYVRYLKTNVPDELYNLAADPEELKNLAGESGHAKELAALRQALPDCAISF